VAGTGWPLSGRNRDRSAEVFALEGEAYDVASRLPELLLEATRISNTVAHGLHGRRRAGPGETFWQFRQYEQTDPSTAIDWRRSASSDHIYVREREWEAAHTLWLWPDLSESMDFRSHLSETTKRDRAIVLTLALADLLVRGGERIALMGLTRPMASRKATTRLAESIVTHFHDTILQSSLPPPEHLPRYSGAILISDFLDPVEKIAERIERLASTGISGHLIQVMDPAEETLPYTGRTEFVGLEDNLHWIADRAESLRQRYQDRLAAHRDALQSMVRRLGWSLLVHHTDRSAAEPLLSIIMRIGSGGQGYRFMPEGAQS
jgi:uncharacterized protein (DUF58 family)